MPRLHSRPDPLQDLDGRLRKQLVQARLFGVDADRRAGERYRICKRLGAGGTGVVYAARDERLGRMVALKLLRADAPTKAARDRLQREARVLARLNHPNIVAVFGLTEYEGHRALVMELVEGLSLRARMSEGKAPDAFELAVAAGRGLAAAHAAGVMHGDFKPENVLIGDEDGVVKVVDFGVARVEQGAVTWPTGRQPDDLATVEGLTPAYAAPERLTGDAADAKSDQYSLCITLWEASTGTRSWTDPGSPQPPRRLRGVLERGLQPAAEDRWPSVEALLQAIEAAQRPRRSWLVVAGVAALASVPLLLPDDADACSRSAAALHARWEPARRARAVERLESAGATQAVAIAESLDAYVHRWNAAHREACIAMKQAPADDSTALDHRFRCLRAQLDAFDTLIVALETAGDVEVASATGSTLSLPDPEHCQGGVSGLEAEVESLLGRAEVLEDIGRPEQALELLDAAKLSYEQGRLEVDLQRAGILTTLDQPADARAMLERTYMRALEQEHPRTAAAAAIALVFNTSRDARHRHQADTWLRHATSMLERIPEHDLALSLEHARAIMVRYTGDRIAAMELFERLEPAVERRYGRGSKQWAKVRYDRAGTCREAGRFDRELELARDGVEAARSVLGEHHRLTLDLESLLGGALVELGHIDEASVVLTATREAFERIYGPEHETLQHVHADLADLADLEDDLDRALDHYDAALTILEKRGAAEGYAAVALVNKRAGVIWRLGDTDRATAEFHRAFDLTVAHAGHASPRAIEILNNLLAHQGRDEQWEAASRTLERGRAWLGHVDDPLSRAHFLFNDGVIEVFRGDVDEGLRRVEEAIALAGTQSSTFAIESRMHLADLLLDRRGTTDDRRRARTLVDEAATIARDAGQDDTAQRTWLAAHDSLTP